MTAGTQRVNDRNAAQAWARELLASDPRSWVILDTETTGLKDAEILQIGLLWPDGATALDCLVQPDFEYLGGSIPSGSTAIHGITDAMVKGCPTFEDIFPALKPILESRRVVIYNCGYDKPIIDGCISRTWDDDRDVFLSATSWECAMLKYSAFIGEAGRFDSYKWQKLPDIGGGKAHNALGDCLSTLEIIKRMAAAQ